MAEDVPAITIEEITGSKRIIRLTGRGLPFRPLPFSTEQRAPTDWLPGSPFGTLTVLGPTEKDTTIHGEWKDKFLGKNRLDPGSSPVTVNSEAVTTVREVDALFHELLRHAQLIEFRWGHIVRRGVLVNYDREWKNLNDLTWHATFRWISLGEDIAPVVFNASGSYGDIKNGMAVEMAGLGDIEVPDIIGVTSSFVTALKDFQNAFQEAATFVAEVAKQVVDLIVSPIRAARDLMATFDDVIRTAEDLLNYVESQFGSETGLDTGPGGAGAAGIILGKPYPVQTESEKRVSLVFLDSLKRWAFRMRSFAATAQETLKTSLGADVSSVYIVRDYQSLKDVAQEVWGSPFEWRRLMMFNDLNGIEVPAGTVVFVPRVDQQDGSSACPRT
jgi:hypothetical protein